MPRCPTRCVNTCSAITGKSPDRSTAISMTGSPRVPNLSRRGRGICSSRESNVSAASEGRSAPMTIFCSRRSIPTANTRRLRPPAPSRPNIRWHQPHYKLSSRKLLCGLTSSHSVSSGGGAASSRSEGMTEPTIITVAITGALPRKAQTPAVPVTPAEQIESTQQAYEAGAALVHIHVRNKDESPSSDPELFAQVQEGVKKHCPGMIVQFSTGGRGRSHNERGRPLNLRPDMASLATGSVNFPTQIYENPPELIEALARRMLEFNVKPEIEVFDLAMLYNARDLAARGLIKRPLHVQFVMGIPNALPARRKVLEFLVSELKDIMPDATWAAAGIGRHQLEVNEWTLPLGGHLRTGLEDNIKFDRHRLASSNAELVARLRDLCGKHGRHAASPKEARAILG